jgi:hypothetical protein
MNPELLIGESLSSVEFFADQVTLRFDDKALTLFAWPLVADAEGISLEFGEPGYRDALCFAIGLTVEKATFEEGLELTMEFDNGSVFALSLREEDMNTAEAGTFTAAGETYEF